MGALLSRPKPSPNGPEVGKRPSITSSKVAPAGITDEFIAAKAPSMVFTPVMTPNIVLLLMRLGWKNS